MNISALVASVSLAAVAVAATAKQLQSPPDMVLTARLSRVAWKRGGTPSLTVALHNRGRRSVWLKREIFVDYSEPPPGVASHELWVVVRDWDGRALESLNEAAAARRQLRIRCGRQCPRRTAA
jgi:hypothetical protein